MKLGETARVAGGKVEALIAAAVLVAVLALFVKYYDRAPASEASGSPSKVTRSGL